MLWDHHTQERPSPEGPRRKRSELPCDKYQHAVLGWFWISLESALVLENTAVSREKHSRYSEKGHTPASSASGSMSRLPHGKARAVAGEERGHMCSSQGGTHVPGPGRLPPRAVGQRRV